MAIKSYRDLDVWKKAMELAEAVYCVTVDFPENEKFGLTSQLRRAAVSVPSNIAEGAGRAGRGDFIRFLSIARGSLSELETQITLAVRLKLIARERVLAIWELAQRIGQMVNKLMAALRKGRSGKKPRSGE